MAPSPPSRLIIEVAQQKKSSLKKDDVRQLLWTHVLTNRTKPFVENPFRCTTQNSHPDLVQHVESIVFCNSYAGPIDATTVTIFVYKLRDGGAINEKLENGDGNEPTSASYHWLLPAREYHGLWESLYFDEGLKDRLLKFVETSMLFAEKQIDPNVISCNRLVLLYGPPGTGKTSLCKAIAQKLAIHNTDRYRFTHLVEINSHSLFSKWFSESGKLVMKLFDDIQTLLENEKSHVCLLIDEVESVAFARQSVSDNEPSDSLRVVNALLTQLDRIRHYPNLLVLTTSNLTASIDNAFMDRADIKQYIGNPTAEAVYSIFASAIQELIKAEIIRTEVTIDLASCASHADLVQIAIECQGFSGRTLRKLPFLAHALHLPTSDATLPEFVAALKAAVMAQKRSESQLKND